jgi:hypothetical protein
MFKFNPFTKKLDITGGSSSHNLLPGLQGGILNQYYHLDSTEHTIATQSSSATLNGYLSSTDWSLFNGKQNALGFTPENSANKEDSVIDTSTTKYPTVNLLKTGLSGKQDSLGYTAENNSNKSDSYTTSSSTTYASTKALVDGLTTKIDSNILNSKVTPIDADSLLLQDSADSNIWKKLTWSNIKVTLLNYLRPLWQQPWIDIQRQGFLNTTETTISFDPVTFIFTIAPTSTTWSYYYKGLKYTITGAKTYTLAGTPPTAGTYYISLDSTDGTLSDGTIPWTLEDQKIPVATINWDNANNPKHWIADERHTVLMDYRDQYYIHTVEGSKAISLPTITGTYVLNSGNDTDKAFGLSASSIMDQDRKHDLALLAEGNGTTTPYVVWYRTAAGTWTWKYSDMPFIYNVGNANNIIQYDLNGTMTDGTIGTGGSTRYVNSYILCTNKTGDARYIFVSGRNQFTSIALAQAENISAFTWAGFMIDESVIVYRCTWKPTTASGKGSAVLSAIPQQVNISTVTNASSGAGTDHETLANLQGGTTNEHYHLTATEATEIGALANNTTNGLWARTGAGTGNARTLTGTTNEITITNGDGVSGNPTISLSAIIALAGKTITNTGTLTLPTSTDTLVGRATTDTLTNKTLSTGTALNGSADPNFTYYGLARQGIINGGCQVQQRVTIKSVSSTYQYAIVDRFAVKATGTAVSAGIITGSTGSGNAGTTGYDVAVTGATLTGSGIMYFRYRMEAKDVQAAYDGRTASISLSVYHNVGSNINYTIYVNKVNSGLPDDWSASTAISNSGAISVATATKTTIKYENISMGSCVNGIEIEVQAACGAITTKGFEWGDIQMNAGSVALPFQPSSFDEELRACQRYYEQIGRGMIGRWGSAIAIKLVGTFRVSKRITSATTILLTTTPQVEETQVIVRTGSGSTIVAASAGFTGINIDLGGFTGATAGAFGHVITDPLIGVDAEL